MTKRASNTFSAPLDFTRSDAPHGPVLLPLHPGDDRFEAAVPPEVELVDDSTEVVAQLRLLAVVLAPQLGRLEGEAVLMAPDVDTCARVAVLPPGAARALVLVDDRKGQPGLPKADAGQDSTHPAADDDDGCRGLLGLRDLVTPGDLSAVTALELQVVEEEAGQPALDGTPAEEAHHLSQQFPGRLHRDAPVVAIGGDRREGTAAYLRHIPLRHAALNVQRDGHVWLDPTSHPRWVTAHVHERAHQCRNADVFERSGDGLVAVLKRLSGETISGHKQYSRRGARTRQLDPHL